MKKAYELSTLTGTQVLLLVVSETGLVYTFTTAKLQPLVTQPEGKNLIQACLNAPHGTLPSNMSVGAPLGRSAPQQMQAPPPPGQPPQSNAPASPANAPGMPAGMPPMGGPRNVPGGLSISGGPGGPGEDGGDDDRGDEVDQESEKRGAPRRRTSQSKPVSNNAGAGANNQAGRSPESPNTHLAHLGLPGQQGGMQNLAGAPPYGAAGGEQGAGAAGAPVYGHPMQHPMMPPTTGYYPPPPMQWGGAAASGAYRQGR